MNTSRRIPLMKTFIKPLNVVEKEKSHYFIDFGKAVFGTVQLDFKSIPESCSIIIRLGETLSCPNTINKAPLGSLRFIEIPLTLTTGRLSYTLTIPPNKRNTGKGAIRMPQEIGEVFPFRYCEIKNNPYRDFKIKQIMIHAPFDDSAAHFSSSNRQLDAVWDLCKHTIKATTFCGIYIDGDRERLPYEGDAYINQLSHYCLDQAYSMARETQEYLLENPTWPTEWQFHIVFMAWEDWMYTGDSSYLKKNYALLSQKSLVALAREDGLISTETELCTREFEESLNLYKENYIFNKGLEDLVDWPPGSFTQGGIGERDNHEMMPINTVINAFHYRALILMHQIAEVLGKNEESLFFKTQAEKVKKSFNRVFFDANTQLYIDGEGSKHSSLHSNLFALDFGLIPEEKKQKVIHFIKSRGMACSVYAAQFLLEALYLNGESDYALGLITSENDRGWLNMIKSGSTMTLEAWDIKYKNNLDGNHAWGTAPTNIISRHLMGIRPLTPGYQAICIQPQPSNLLYAECQVPTKHGKIKVKIKTNKDSSLEIDAEIPKGCSAKIIYPDGTTRIL